VTIKHIEKAGHGYGFEDLCAMFWDFTKCYSITLNVVEDGSTMSHFWYSKIIEILIKYN